MKFDLREIIRSKKNLTLVLALFLAAGALLLGVVLFQKHKPPGAKSRKTSTPTATQATGGASGGGSYSRGPVGVPIARPIASAVARPVAQASSSARLIPSSIPDPSIVRIQQQINEIMRLNEMLKGRNQSQMAEIQRISDQARIHQKILKNLQVEAETEGKEEVKASDAAAILYQEKLRLIRDETETNRKKIQELQEKNSQESDKKN